MIQEDLQQLVHVATGYLPGQEQVNFFFCVSPFVGKIVKMLKQRPL